MGSLSSCGHKLPACAQQTQSSAITIYSLSVCPLQHHSHCNTVLSRYCGRVRNMNIQLILAACWTPLSSVGPAYAFSAEVTIDGNYYNCRGSRALWPFATEKWRVDS